MLSSFGTIFFLLAYFLLIYVCQECKEHFNINARQNEAEKNSVILKRWLNFIGWKMIETWYVSMDLLQRNLSDFQLMTFVSSLKLKGNVTPLSFWQLFRQKVLAIKQTLSKEQILRPNKANKLRRVLRINEHNPLQISKGETMWKRLITMRNLTALAYLNSLYTPPSAEKYWPIFARSETNLDLIFIRSHLRQEKKENVFQGQNFHWILMFPNTKSRELSSHDTQG